MPYETILHLVQIGWLTDCVECFFTYHARDGVFIVKVYASREGGRWLISEC